MIFFGEKFIGIFLQKFFPKGFPLFFEKFQGIFLQKKIVKKFTCKFEQEFHGLFFFSKKSKGISLVKLKVSEEILKGFFL